ncbi:MAG: dihydroorotase family protein, partial [Candidatus Brockarchaeota archaeon]|nr:dihydroorotase family protein [Candidatus Brockarchaeota archaeon]
PRLASSLIEALRDGSIAMVASDHAPHSLEEKKGDAPLPGIPGLETTLPLVLSLVHKGAIDLATLLKAMSSGPAKSFGLEGRGCLDVGMNADLTVVDLKRPWTIDSSKFFSKAKYSPFDGLEVKGCSWATMVGGKLVMQDGEVTAQPGTGSILSWGRF